MPGIVFWLGIICNFAEWRVGEMQSAPPFKLGLSGRPPSFPELRYVDICAYLMHRDYPEKPILRTSY